MAALSGSARANPIADFEQAQRALFEDVSPSVVFVSTGSGFGSGMVVQSDGLILTNAHVVGKSTKVKVVTHDGRTFDGTVVEKGAVYDLALVKIDAKGLPAVTLGDAPTVRVGDWVGSVGHGRGGIWTYTTGMISNLYGDDPSKPVYQTQIPLNPGASGGPIFDRDGTVIAVVTSGMTDAEAINFAIPSIVALQDLEALGGACACISVTAPAGLPVFVDGTMVGTGPSVRVPVEAGKHVVFAIVGGKKVERTVRYPDEKAVDLTQ